MNVENMKNYEVAQLVESIMNRYYQLEESLKEDEALYAKDYYLIRRYAYNKPAGNENELVFNLIDTAIVYGFMKGRDSR